MQLELPWPPSVNHYWHRGPHGRTYLNKAGKEYRTAAMGQVTQRIEGPCEVFIEVYPPDRRRRDLDNLLKPILDALGHAGVYADDSQVRKLTIVSWLREVQPPGSVVVWVRSYEDGD